MTWFKVDDGFWRHRKVRLLGKDRVAAVGLWTLAGDYSADNTTDGSLTREEVEDWDARHRLARRLVDVRLWHEVDASGCLVDECAACGPVTPGHAGYLFHEWHEHQPTREEVLDKRRKRQEAGRLGGVRSAQSRRAKAEANASAPAAANAEAPAASGPKQKRTPSRPVPSSPNGEESPVASPPAHDSAGTIVAEWIGRCAKRPPGNVIGQIGKHVKAMLDEGIDPNDVRRGLADWMTRDVHPSVLPSLVNTAMNRVHRPAPSTSQTDANIAALLNPNGQPPTLRALPGGA